MRDYNILILDFFEPYMERSKESLKRSKISEEEYKKGKVKTVEEIFNK